MNLSIILRLFLKHHTDIALSVNIKKLFINELDNYGLTTKVIDNFYKIISNKLLIIYTIKRFQLLYKNNFFWKLQYQDQYNYLLNIKEQFMSIFDCSKGGIPYYYKLSLLKNYNGEIKEDSKNRLSKLLKIFGIRLFNYLEIPIINYDEFDILTKEQIIKYYLLIYEKFNKLLNQTIETFESYNLNTLELENLFKPFIININTNDVDSETEVEDIKLISK